MRALILTAVALLCIVATSPAEARRHGHHRAHHHHAKTHHRAHVARPILDRELNAHIGPRPSKWCGWWMRLRHGGGPRFNLAWSWSKWGIPSAPQTGAIVVWRHHVGEITGRAANGLWIVLSGNDGGRVRERPRSVAGAVFRVGGF
jgi:hypothetical protein